MFLAEIGVLVMEKPHIEDSLLAKKFLQKKNSRFANRLSQLRKERDISQKKAATDLGISQALLSHYEKGIRECGLDFVVKCSEYYNVTTDYLLGVSENRNGIDFTSFENIINGTTGQKDEENATLTDATKILLNCSASSVDESAAKYIHDYFVLSLYRSAVTLAKVGALPKELFKIDYSLGRELANAAMAVIDAKFVFIEDKSRTGADLSERSALHILIEEAEDYILNNFVIN